MLETREEIRSDRRHALSRDYRDAYQHDRDRILNTMALRRLVHVTQVVSPEEGRFYHNRFTHSLKVAMIARRLAEYLIEKSSPKLIAELGGLSPDVVEAAALAHDLGHPPFGHIGELELNECVRAKGLNDGYEGNAQTFRILTKLEVSSPNVSGLDLTRATLNAVQKYPWYRPVDKEVQEPEVDQPQEKEVEDPDLKKKKKKWGAYRTEQEDFVWARDLRLPHSVPIEEHNGMGLEAAIMDWADDIAYATHDVEDFYAVGRIPLERFTIEQYLPQRDDYWRADDRDHILESKEFLRKATEWINEGGGKEARKVSLKDSLHVFDSLFRITFFGRYRGERKQQALLREWAGILVTNYITSTELNSDAATSSEEFPLKISDHQFYEIKLLKYLTRYYVWNDPALLSQQTGETKIVRDLFDIYFTQASHNGEDGLFPPNYQDLLQKESKIDHHLSEDALKARIVADFVSSLTDKQAIELHHRLTGHTMGNYLDTVPFAGL